jgi:hypothetical protein
MPTIETLKNLPAIGPLRQRAQALAAMDAIMSPDWRYRYFLFNSAWSPDEMMATMTNGSGDDLFLLFTEAGAILKGFDHESFMSPWARDEKALWKGLFTSVPKEFAGFLTEPAFTIEDSTFCTWKRLSDDAWQSDEIKYPDDDGDADGSHWMLQEYIEGASCYVDFCRDYYKQEVALEMVQEFYNFTPLTERMLHGLNAELVWHSVTKDFLEIGYPVCS